MQQGKTPGLWRENRWICKRLEREMMKRSSCLGWGSLGRWEIGRSGHILLHDERCLVSSANRRRPPSATSLGRRTTHVGGKEGRRDVHGSTRKPSPSPPNRLTPPSQILEVRERVWRRSGIDLKALSKIHPFIAWPALRRNVPFFVWCPQGVVMSVTVAR